MATPLAPPRAPNNVRSLHSTAWLLVIVVPCVVCLPLLLTRGMSLDGVIYATISRNMALGMGEFWHPAFTDDGNRFIDSPPLAFLLESVFFCALGDRWWVERLYSLSTALPTGCILVLIWRRLAHGSGELRNFAWLPLALWLSMPSWYWIYRNNYLENTLGIFTALAVHAAVRLRMPGAGGQPGAALLRNFDRRRRVDQRPRRPVSRRRAAVIGLTLGRDKMRIAARNQLALVALLIAIAALIWSYAPRARVSFRLLPLSSHRQPARTARAVRFALRPLSAARRAALRSPRAVLARRRLRAVGQATRHGDAVGRGCRPARFCLLTALSGSLPIMVSPKQAAFYAAASWPFYAMALACWCQPAVAAIVNRLASRPAADRVPRWLCAGAACAASGLHGAACLFGMAESLAIASSSPTSIESASSSVHTPPCRSPAICTTCGRCTPICSAGISSQREPIKTHFPTISSTGSRPQHPAWSHANQRATLALPPLPSRSHRCHASLDSYAPLVAAV